MIQSSKIRAHGLLKGGSERPCKSEDLRNFKHFFKNVVKIGQSLKKKKQKTGMATDD